MSQTTGLRSPETSPEPEVGLTPEEEIVEPVMGPILPLTDSNAVEICTRLTEHHQAIVRANNAHRAAAEQYRELIHTISESLGVLCPVLTARDRTKIRDGIASLTTCTQKVGAHVTNSFRRLMQAWDMLIPLMNKNLTRLADLPDMADSVKTQTFTSCQMTMAASVSEEVSAGRWLKKGSDEVEPVLELLQELVAKSEGQSGRDVGRLEAFLEGTEDEDGDGDFCVGGS